METAGVAGKSFLASCAHPTNTECRCGCSTPSLSWTDGVGVGGSRLATVWTRLAHVGAARGMRAVVEVKPLIEASWRVERYRTGRWTEHGGTSRYTFTSKRAYHRLFLSA